VQLLKNFQALAFISCNPKVLSLLCSQAPSTGRCPEPDQSLRWTSGTVAGFHHVLQFSLPFSIPSTNCHTLFDHATDHFALHERHLIAKEKKMMVEREKMGNSKFSLWELLSINVGKWHSIVW
jgi:hypothetical protein